MFGRNAKSEIDSLIGISARIEGDLVFTGGLRIDGEVHGNVIAGDAGESVLIVSEHARIEGEVRCANLVVNGYIAGTVFSTELLELQPKGAYMGMSITACWKCMAAPGDGQADPRNLSDPGRRAGVSFRSGGGRGVSMTGANRL